MTLLGLMSYICRKINRESILYVENGKRDTFTFTELTSANLVEITEPESQVCHEILETEDELVTEIFNIYNWK